MNSPFCNFQLGQARHQELETEANSRWGQPEPDRAGQTHSKQRTLLGITMLAGIMTVALLLTQYL